MRLFGWEAAGQDIEDVAELGFLIQVAARLELTAFKV